jgi:hypothetical protein
VVGAAQPEQEQRGHRRGLRHIHSLDPPSRPSLLCALRTSSTGWILGRRLGWSSAATGWNSGAATRVELGGDGLELEGGDECGNGVELGID